MSLINETLKNLDKKNKSGKEDFLSGLSSPQNYAPKKWRSAILLLAGLVLIIILSIVIYINPHSKKMEMTALPLNQQEKSQALYQDALQAISNNQPRSAIRELQAVLHLAPDNVEAREALATLLAKMGQNHRANQIVAEGLVRDPDNLELVQLQTHILVSQNKIKPALAILQQHAPVINQAPDYYAYMASLYQHAGDYMVAARIYDDLVKLDPSQALWWVGLGIALESAGKNNAAIEAYDHALQGSLDVQTRGFVENKLASLS